MSDKLDRKGECAGKTAYASSAEAHKQLRYREKRQKNRRDNRGAAHTYRCSLCKQWHIGTAS